MNRRDFLKSAAIAGAALSVPMGLDPILTALVAAEKTDLAVAGGTPPAKITRAAVDALGGMKRFVSRGDVVVVKPNIGWDRTPEYAANTNPDVVAAVVRLCFEAGAKTVKVFDHTVTDPRRTYKQSGIADAATAAGATVSFIDDRKFKDMQINGRSLKSWPLYTELFEADKVINVPIAKTHGISKLTLGMKNWMGVMGGWRGRIHQRVDESIVDLAMFIKPALTVLDAVRILTANGPQGGNLADVKQLNMVIAGTDAVAVDAFGATLFGMKPAELGCVRIGHELKLGSMDLEKMKIKRITV
ncbi:MAG: cytoplasmic protein [Syntrophus sp. (in: bacteria)]|nr:cytoplasmic protein [Syntrophus sp. (in: bacteria)]